MKEKDILHVKAPGNLYLYYSAVRCLEPDPENIHVAKNGHMETRQDIFAEPHLIESFVHGGWYVLSNVVYPEIEKCRR